MGFLSNLLPAIAGGALVATGVGAPAAAAMLGGLQYARTGSLNKGLMAGLGAYGGYGLGEGLAGAGANATAAEMSGGLSGASPAELSAAKEGAIQQGAYDNMGKGLSGLQTPEGRSAFMQNIGGGSGLLKSGLAATAPAMLATPNQSQVNPTDSSPGQRYAYSPGAVNPTPAPDLNPNMGGGSGREQLYYTPSYRKISDTEAKSIYGYADGGDVKASKYDPLAVYNARQAEYANRPAPKQVDVAGDYANYIKGLNPMPTPAAKKVITPENKPVQFDYDPKSPDFTPEQARANVAKATSNFEDWSKEYMRLNPDPVVPLEIKPRVSENSTVPTGNPNDNPGYTYNAGTQSFARTNTPAAINPSVAAPAAPAAFAGGQDGSWAYGGITYAGGGAVEAMSNASALGENTGYPTANIAGHAYATPWQTPMSQNVVEGSADTGVNRMTGQMLATGGISDAYYNLGGYSDGGRLLRGPGDGVSDSIPAVIGNKRPARLADGEFVVPARIVSELGNGSTEAGARKLYAMLDRVQAARKNTVGKDKVAKNNRADKYLPA